MRMHAIRDRGQPALPRYSYPGRYMEKHLFAVVYVFLLVLLVFYYWCIICLFSLQLFVFSV